MNLRNLARPYKAFAASVTLWFMPYATLRQQLVSTAFEKFVPRATLNDRGELAWNTFEFTFVMVESLIVECEFHTVENAAVEAFQAYWQARSDDLAVNWRNYQYLPQSAIAEFWNGYEATRDVMGVANGHLGELKPASEMT